MTAAASVFRPCAFGAARAWWIPEAAAAASATAVTAAEVAAERTDVSAAVSEVATAVMAVSAVVQMYLLWRTLLARHLQSAVGSLL